MCLQFPDHLLHEAAPVARALQQRLGQVFSAYVPRNANHYDDDKKILAQDVLQIIMMMIKRSQLRMFSFSVTQHLELAVWMR